MKARQVTRVTLIAVLVVLLRVAPPVHATPIVPGQGLSFSQISFTFVGASQSFSQYGLAAVDIAVLSTAMGGPPLGFVNVVDASGMWIVQNLPVDTSSSYLGISTMFDLGTSGPVSNVLVEADFSLTPLTSPPSGPAVLFPVSQNDYNAEGVGDLRPAPPAPGNVPDPNLVVWNAPNFLNTFLRWQPGHTSVEQDYNQCAPGALANSLDWLRITYPAIATLNPLLLNIPGINGNPPNSLVGQIDNSMGRVGSSANPIRIGRGVSLAAPVRGKLAFIDNAANGLKGKLVIAHRPVHPKFVAAVGGTQRVGMTSSTDDVLAGPALADWIIREIENGEDVELVWLWDGTCAAPPASRGNRCSDNPQCDNPAGSGNGRCAQSGHAVDLIGAGRIGGVPWIAFVHDAQQGGACTAPPTRVGRPCTVDVHCDDPPLSGNGRCRVLAGTRFFEGGIGWSTLTANGLLPTWVGGKRNKASVGLVVSESPVSPFQCYETKPHNLLRTVSLSDQFGSATVQLLRPDRICNPADKNGENPTAVNRSDHLEGLRTKQANFTAVRNLQVVNQFGTITVDAVRPDRLLVPTAKSLTSAPQPLTPPTIDHFRCYRVRPSRGASPFTPIVGVPVTDEFGSRTVVVKKPLLLCNPVNKNGESPGAENDATHLLCYRIISSSPLRSVQPIFVNNQFGPDTLQALRVEELCVPSLKSPAPTTTSTTSTTTTTLPNVCGDGVVAPPEQCDPPGPNSPECPASSPMGAFVTCKTNCQCSPSGAFLEDATF